MLFDAHRPVSFREVRTRPDRIGEVVATERSAVEDRANRNAALAGWALHRSLDAQRIVVVEAWQDERAFKDRDACQSTALYLLVGAGGLVPTPVGDSAAGVIIIDLFPVWRPLLRAVAAFNLKNGEAFNRAPGCISTSVLRGVTTAGIATYARWRTVEDFTAAFARQTGRSATSIDDVNRAAARMTLGLIRPDYHAYELVASGGDAD